MHLPSKKTSGHPAVPDLILSPVAYNNPEPSPTLLISPAFVPGQPKTSLIPNDSKFHPTDADNFNPSIAEPIRNYSVVTNASSIKLNQFEPINRNSSVVTNASTSTNCPQRSQPSSRFYFSQFSDQSSLSQLTAISLTRLTEKFSGNSFCRLTSGLSGLRRSTKRRRRPSSIFTVYNRTTAPLRMTWYHPCLAWAPCFTRNCLHVLFLGFFVIFLAIGLLLTSLGFIDYGTTAKILPLLRVLGITALILCFLFLLCSCAVLSDCVAASYFKTPRSGFPPREYSYQAINHSNASNANRRKFFVSALSGSVLGSRAGLTCSSSSRQNSGTLGTAVIIVPQAQPTKKISSRHLSEPSCCCDCSINEIAEEPDLNSNITEGVNMNRNILINNANNNNNNLNNANNVHHDTHDENVSTIRYQARAESKTEPGSNTVIKQRDNTIGCSSSLKSTDNQRNSTNISNKHDPISQANPKNHISIEPKLGRNVSSHSRRETMSANTDTRVDVKAEPVSESVSEKHLPLRQLVRGDEHEQNVEDGVRSKNVTYVTEAVSKLNETNASLCEEDNGVKLNENGGIKQINSFIDDTKSITVNLSTGKFPLESSEKVTDVSDTDDDIFSI